MRSALPIRTLLHQQYLIGRVLGDGGFGITYLAWDTKLETRVAIKEYMPDGLAGRGSGGLNVCPRSSKHTDGFAYGCDRFLAEARTLAKFDHANIMRVRTFFEENGTGYLVMDYYDGVSLAEYLEKHDGKISEKDALELITPIMDGLREVHSKKFLHRDIKPQNIYLTAGNRPILLDFGSARMDASDRDGSQSVILSHGFAPFEQYYRKGNQGPWTDVYACAAVLYYMTTKTKPPDAPERNKKDELVPPKQLVQEISSGFNRAILKALAVEPEDRPQSIEKFQKILAGYGGTEVLEPEAFYYVDCPHCNTKNKILKDKQLKEAKCIKCKKILEKPETEAEKKERQEVEKQKQEQDRILREAEELKLRETREQELREREEEARSKKIAKLVKKGNSILEYKSYDRAIKYFKDILEIDAEHKEGQELLLKAQTEKSEAEKLKREEIERDEQERIRREAVELKQREAREKQHREREEAKRKEKEARDEQVRERKREREEEVKRKKIAKQKNAKPESSSFIKSVPGVIWGLAGIGTIAVLALLIWLIIHNGNVKSQQAALNEQIKQIEADKQRIADEKAALEEKARVEAKRQKTRATEEKKARLAEAKKKQQELERIKKKNQRLADEKAALEEKARVEAERQKMLAMEAEKRRQTVVKEKQQEIERIKREKRRLASENAELEEEARLAEIEKIQMEIKQRNAEEKARLAELSTSIAKYDTEVAKLNVLVTEASKQNYTGTPRVNLRSSYSTLDTDDVKSMLKRYNFFDKYKNENGNFQNDYKQKSINGDRVVIDHATGLMWHQSGSSDTMEWNEAKDWVKELNRRGYAGHNDWRLPTVEEAASLLESSEKNGDLYIDPLFSNKQWWIWTGDKKDGSEAAWRVNFYGGVVLWHYVDRSYYVRPVRSGK